MSSELDEDDGSAAKNGHASPSAANPDDAQEQLGMGGMIERWHGVTNRDAPAPRKHKPEIVEDENEDESHKRAKMTSNQFGSGGILGEHLKSEREKGAAETGPSTEPIDLTNEEEDEIVFIGETQSDGNKEVCMGRLHANANAFRVPTAPRRQNGVLGSDMWPQMKVEHRRDHAQNYIIHLYDRPGGNTGTKFGQMHFREAAALCPLLDGNHVNKLRLKIFVEPFEKREGEFPGSRTSRSLPLSIMLYAPRKFADGIGRQLSQKGLFLSAPLNPGHGVEYFNPHVPQNFGPTKTGVRKPQSSQATYGVARTHEDMVRDASNMFDSLAKRSENLPEMDPDPTLILTPLMAHQKQALHFLTEHERADQDVSQDDTDFSLWKERMNYKGTTTWYNIITNHEVTQKPEPVRGGILADMMGLGKTLSILALITNTLADAREFGEMEPPLNMDGAERNSKATLIICPKSVMSNWDEQIKLHTRPKRLKVYSYHGASRTQDLDELTNYNVVLTSYSTAAAEFSDKKSYKRNALASIQWFRIVLDEGHQIRTQSTQVSKACCGLFAQRRWAVTGTPVQNRLDDLGALIKFLRIKPFDDNVSWSQHILAPFRNANENVLQHLRLLVDSITLRRQKDKIGLTERRENRFRLDFSDAEWEIYRQFSQESNLQLRIMLSKSSRLQGKSYAHVLKSLGRLRAICAHGREMLKEEDLKALDGLTAGTAIELGDEPNDNRGPEGTFIDEKHAYETLHMMSESEVDICINCSRKIGDQKVDPDAVADVSDEEPDSESEDESAESSEVNAASDTMGYLTPCYHLLCPRCKDKHIEQTKPKLTEDHYHKCVYCDQYVRFGLRELRRSGLKAMLEARDKVNQKGNRTRWDESTYSGPHTKVKALLDDLHQSAIETSQLPEDEPPIRSVVFSGWTTYLDLIEYALDMHDIGYVRLDGSMSIKARSSVLTTFKTDPKITVLLVSIKAGGQGLNFTVASKVYMMEPQFNPGVEQQAIDRVHRLGQKRDVNIVHYIMKDSVEEKILKLQEKKEKLARLSMEKKMSKSDEAKKRIEELRELFK